MVESKWKTLLHISWEEAHVLPICKVYVTRMWNQYLLGTNSFYNLRVKDDAMESPNHSRFSTVLDDNKKMEKELAAFQDREDAKGLGKGSIS